MVGVTQGRFCAGAELGVGGGKKAGVEVVSVASFGEKKKKKKKPLRIQVFTIK